MQITIEPTGMMQSVNGAPARIWRGKTDKGVEVKCFICMVQVHKDSDNAEFERELREVVPERQLVSFDYRLVL